MNAWTWWLIIAGICFILEIASEGFLMVWFGVGALVAMGISFFINNFIIQLITFIVSSTILVLCTRKFSKKIEPKTVATNVYTIIGKKAVVSLTIDNVKGQGQIKIDGDIWSAKTENDEIISEGSAVEILRIEGVKAIIKKPSIELTS